MSGTESPLASSKTKQFLKLYFSKLFSLIAAAILTLLLLATFMASLAAVTHYTQRAIVAVTPAQMYSPAAIYGATLVLTALAAVAVGLLYLAAVTYEEIEADENDTDSVSR